MDWAFRTIHSYGRLARGISPGNDSCPHHRMRSGLTGWAQVSGLRGETSLTDRVEWDNHYIENWTPWLDFKILLLTVPQFLRHPQP